MKPYAPAICARRGQTEFRVLFQETINRDPPFHTGKRQADADMRATCECQMTVGVPGNIKMGRIVEYLGVAIGRADTQMQIRSSRNFIPADRYRPCCFPIAKLIG